MSRAKLMLAAFTVALALSAIGTTAVASADSWFVGGTKVGETSKIALNSKAVVDERAVLNDPGLGLKVSCGGLTGAGAALIGLDAGEAENLSFTECSEIEPSTCKVTPAEVVTEAVTALAVLGLLPNSKTETTFINFKPKTGKTFATIKFVGTCPFAGEQPVNGLVKLEAPGAETEAASHTLTGIGSIENNSLEIDAQKAFIEKGKALVSLASGASFSFHA